MGFDHAARRAVLQELIHVQRDGKPPAVAGRSALGVQQVIEAIMESSRSGVAVSIRPAAISPQG